MRQSLRLSIALAAVLGWLAPAGAGEAPDPADQLLEETVPPPAKEPAPPKPTQPPAKLSVPEKPAVSARELTPEEAAKLQKELKAVTDRMLADARAYYKLRDWDRAAAKCDEVLKRDPGNLEAQELKYQAERDKIDLRLRMLKHESEWKDKDAIGDLDEASMFPDKHAPLPRPVNAPKIGPLPLREGKPVKSEKLLLMEQKLNQRVDINFVDADLDFVMATLFRVTGVNIIADQNALKNKRLTLHVENMPLKEILRFIVRNNTDINYTVTEDAVWVSAGGSNPGMEPRVHALNVGLVISTPIQAQQQAQRAPAQPGVPARPPAQQQQQPGQQQPTVTYLEEAITWMEGWKEWPGGSKWTIDKATSALLVYTTPEMHEKIDEMLEMLDRPPIQVLISTRFITVSVDDLKDIGLDFSINSNPRNKIQLGVGSGTNLGASTIPGGLSAIVVGADTDPLFTATLKALEKTGRGKLLSAPQIITLNNQKGHIDITTAFNWVNNWTPVTTTETITGGGGTTQSQTVTYMVPQITQTNVGFTLDVTPSVGRDLRHIVLELIPFITDVEGGTKQFGTVQVLQTNGTEPPPPIVQPVVNTKTLNTRLVTSDGDLVVIGGLMGQDTTKAITKVPILGDIPLLGYLFRHTTDTVIKTHLIIVVKAQIIDPSGRTYTDGNGKNGAAAAAPRKEPVEGPFFTYPEPAGAAAAGK